MDYYVRIYLLHFGSFPLLTVETARPKHLCPVCHIYYNTMHHPKNILLHVEDARKCCYGCRSGSVNLTKCKFHHEENDASARRRRYQHLSVNKSSGTNFYDEFLQAQGTASSSHKLKNCQGPTLAYSVPYFDCETFC